MDLTTLKEIESKYVGTGHEHDVLRSFIQNYERIDGMLHKRYNEMVANKEAELVANQQLYDALQGMKIDEAVYQWLRNRALSCGDSYDLRHVVRALMGRGLTCQDIELILEEFRQQPTS